jgi:hypothetical protein
VKLVWIPCFLSALATASLAATPQYSPRTDIPTGFQRLSGLAVADFNGDGKPDFAVTDGLGKSVVVYLNKGDGSFSSPVSTALQISNTVGSIVTGDFNEDGKLDVIVGTVAGINQNEIFLSGNGDGSFTPQAPLPGSFGFFSAAVMDINHDSHLDFIAGGNGTLFIYLGNGHGSFTLQPVSNQGSSGAFFGIAAGDFNNDNKIDFLSAAVAPYNNIRYFSGNGDGSFSSPTFLSSNLIQDPLSLASADFNGDGKLDLLIGSANVAWIAFGNGDGTFLLNDSDVSFLPTPHTGALTQSPPLVATADMDSDGKPDAVTADSLADALCVFINDGTGKFPLRSPDFTASLDAGTGNIGLADLNGDGLPDIILTNYLTQNVSIFLSIRPKTAPAVTLTASANLQLVGAPLAFTAKVAGTSNVVPTGTVQLMDGTSALGQQTLDSNGQAVFSLSNLTTGQHSLSASYGGDKSYLVASSSPLSQSVTDFQLPSSPASQAVTAGGTATFTLNVSPSGGFVGSIAFTCSQLPALASCDPLTVSMNGQPVVATITVHTTAPHTQHRSLVKAAGFGLISILFTIFLPSHRRSTSLRLVAVALAFAAISLTVGCSGNGSSSTTPPVTVPGTPSGSTTFTITSSATVGSQTATHSTTATLIVQ